MEKKICISEIARRAGVSRQTVYNAIKGEDAVKVDTLIRIEEASDGLINASSYSKVIRQLRNSVKFS